MTNDHLKFSEDLIKGRIAETIFEQMFRECGKFTVLRFGYEYTMPEIAQYRHLAEVQDVLKNMRNAPDFALITHDKKGVYLVEVKYRHRRSDKDIKMRAEYLHRVWNPCWIFIASPDGFFLEQCSKVIKNNGVIAPLSWNWINSEIQEDYLKLLRKFESNNT